MEEVSDKELAEDIENTKIEMEAYDKLFSGYCALALLPENKGNSPYSKASILYLNLRDECSEFLKKLEDMRMARITGAHM
jgi:hypothetical protein